MKKSSWQEGYRGFYWDEDGKPELRLRSRSYARSGASWVGYGKRDATKLWNFLNKVLEKGTK